MELHVCYILWIPDSKVIWFYFYFRDKQTGHHFGNDKVVTYKCTGLKLDGTKDAAASCKRTFVNRFDSKGYQLMHWKHGNYVPQTKHTLCWPGPFDPLDNMKLIVNFANSKCVWK